MFVQPLSNFAAHYPIFMTQIKSKECQGFFEHWKSLRADGAFKTSQQDFLNSLHPKFVPRLYITELIGSEMIIRFMGTALVESWGRDKTGEVLGKDQPANFRVAMFTNSRLAISSPCGLHGTVVLEANHGSPLEIEAVSLPLGVEDGKPGRLVAYCHVQKRPNQGEANGLYSSFPGTTWVDIGAGVPGMAPLSDGS